jgi:hypothetical protein
MKRLCKTKAEVIIALPLVREALAMATDATLDCTADRMTLTIDIDMAKIVSLLETAIADVKGKEIHI